MAAHGQPGHRVTLYTSDDLVWWDEVARGTGWVATSSRRADRGFFRMTTNHPTDD